VEVGAERSKRMNDTLGFTYKVSLIYDFDKMLLQFAFVRIEKKLNGAINWAIWSSKDNSISCSKNSINDIWMVMDIEIVYCEAVSWASTSLAYGPKQVGKYISWIKDANKVTSVPGWSTNLYQCLPSGQIAIKRM
jgi:hypothetical protein